MTSSSKHSASDIKTENLLKYITRKNNRDVNLFKGRNDKHARSLKLQNHCQCSLFKYIHKDVVTMIQELGL